MKKFIMGFKYAFEGIFSAFKTERNMRVHGVAMIGVTIAGLVLKLSQMEWFVCIILFALVISGEIINTAIETIVNFVCPEINPYAKRAKDLAAGAVLVLALGAAIIGLIIFVPKLLNHF